MDVVCVRLLVKSHGEYAVCSNFNVKTLRPLWSEK